MKRAAFGAVAAAGLMACGGTATDAEPGPGKGFYADHAPPTRQEWAALAQLRSEGATVDEALFRNGAGGLLLLRGAFGAAEPGPFIAAHPALFRQAEVVAQTQLNLADGFSIRAVQAISDRRALGRGLVFRYDAQSQLVEVAGRLEASCALPDPILSADDAISAARAIHEAPVVSVENVAWTAENTPPRGAYRIVLDDELGAATRIAVVVDDQSGDVLETEEELEFIAGSGRGVFGNRESLEIDHPRSRDYSLLDSTRGKGLYTFEANGTSLPGDLVSSTSKSSWDSSGHAAGAAVDAHAHTAQVYDFLRDVLGQDSLDGAGAELMSTVHFGPAGNKAFWDGTQAIYGDGDGIEFAPLAADLSVVGHELFHGWIQHACQLGRMGQSGALHEALADALASLLLVHVNDPNAWRLGSAVFTPNRGGDAIRDLKDPASLGQPDHRFAFELLPMDHLHDNGGAHWNAPIPGHALYLLSEGGTNRRSGLHVRGLGADLATQVIAQAARAHLNSSADWVEAAQATRAAARELGGEEAADVARDAWEAVGVLVPEPVAVPAQDDADEREPNDTRLLATPLSRGARLHGRLDGDGDVDLFRLQLDDAQDLEVELGDATGDVDLALLDGLGGRLGHLEAGPAPLPAALLRGHAEAGTYFLKVRAAPGARGESRYRIAVR